MRINKYLYGWVINIVDGEHEYEYKRMWQPSHKMDDVKQSIRQLHHQGLRTRVYSVRRINPDYTA